MPEYDVTVVYTQRVTGTVTLKAKDEETAQERVEKRCEDIDSIEKFEKLVGDVEFEVEFEVEDINEV